MVSPELLRRYPFFGLLDEDQLRQVSMITDIIDYEAGSLVLREGDSAEALFLLISGGLDLYFTVGQEQRTKSYKELPVGEINPGEIFGISALIEPHILTSSIRASSPVQALKIDGQGLNRLCEKDTNLSCKLNHQVAKVAMERLHATRIQLAACYA